MAEHVYCYKCDVAHAGETAIFIAVICRPDQEAADEAFAEIMETHHFERTGDLQTRVDPDPEGDPRLAALLRKARENPTRSATQYVVCS